MRRWLLAAALLAVLPADGAAAQPAGWGEVAIEERFGDGSSSVLVGAPRPRHHTWRATSGRLLLDHGAGSTGDPERDGTEVTRIVSRAEDLGDLRVRFRLSPVSFVTTDRTPAHPWDGVHVALRYVRPQEMYYVSVTRRDGLVTIKKKLPGGRSAGGHYVTLASARRAQPDRWRDVTAQVWTISESGDVALELRIDGVLVLSALDDGSHGPVIARPGAIGLRADNAAFRIDDLTAERL